jgi:hypothetical protein
MKISFDNFNSVLNFFVIIAFIKTLELPVTNGILELEEQS